jgi:hypothetical protein
MTKSEVLLVNTDLLPNLTRHRIAALWREGMNPKGCGWAARGARGR